MKQTDDFDALLEPGPRPAAPATPPHPEHAISGHAEHPPLGTAELHAEPSWDEFVAGWPLYRDPVACAVIAGAALGALGVFVVLRRAVFVTATLSQAAGLGVALAFYLQIHHGLGLSPVLGALSMSALATLLVGARPGGQVSRETLVGAAFVTTSALAVLLGDRIAQEAHDISAVLFGTAVLVRPLDLWLVSAASVLALALLYALGRALTFSGFDPEGARVQGLPVRRVELAFWLVFALQVSVSTRALGALPVFALAVLPAAAAVAVGQRLGLVLALASIGGAASGGAGYLFAFFGELPVGASQAACAALFALLVYVAVRLRRGVSNR
jgi:zinc transport system permease protein